MIRTPARLLMGGIFVVSGLEVLRNPEPRAKASKPVIDQVNEFLPNPIEPVSAVEMNALVHLGAGSMLALGVLPRIAATALALSLIPTTIAGHRFWEIEDPAQRGQQQTHFLKNAAILGGLLLAALD